MQTEIRCLGYVYIIFLSDQRLTPPAFAGPLLFCSQLRLHNTYYFQLYGAKAATCPVSPKMVRSVFPDRPEEAGQLIGIDLVCVPAVKRAGLGIRGKRPVGEHIDAIAARNAACVDQPVFVRPVAEPEESRCRPL